MKIKQKDIFNSWRKGWPDFIGAYLLGFVVTISWLMLNREIVIWFMLLSIIVPLIAVPIRELVLNEN